MRTKEMSKSASPFPRAVAAVIMTLLALGAGVTRANSIVVNNFSFENPDVGDGVVDTNIIGWTTGGAIQYVYDPTNTPTTEWNGVGGDNANTAGVLPDGGQVFLISNYSGGGSIQQTVGTVQADYTYTLTVAIGTRADLASFGWTIELLAGPTVIASATDTTGPAGGTWVDHSAMAGPFDALSPNVGEPLIIELAGTAGGPLNSQIFFDDVRLTAIPEPATGGILLVASLLGLRRRRTVSPV